jgi:hypothetical protein
MKRCPRSNQYCSDFFFFALSDSESVGAGSYTEHAKADGEDGAQEDWAPVIAIWDSFIDPTDLLPFLVVYVYGRLGLVVLHSRSHAGS